MAEQHSTSSVYGLLVARMAASGALPQRESETLRAIAARASNAWKPDSRMSASADNPARFITTGWACQARVLGDGRRQIANILLPGDFIGLCSAADFSRASDVFILSPLRTVSVHEATSEWRDRVREPAFAAAIETLNAEHVFFLLGHTVRLGRQTAYERIANWLMELEYRLSSRGLAKDGAFQFPLTQETIADVVGLSVVHVNRTLQQMRREGRIELRSGYLDLLDREGLRAAGEFVAPGNQTTQIRALERRSDQEGSSRDLEHGATT